MLATGDCCWTRSFHFCSRLLLPDVVLVMLLMVVTTGATAGTAAAAKCVVLAPPWSRFFSGGVLKMVYKPI